MFHVSNFCRICTRTECTLIDISSVDTDNIKLSDKLKYCITEAIHENDILPKLLCDTCCKNLKISYTLKNMCLKTQMIFCGVVNEKKNENTLSINSDRLIIKEEPISDIEEEMKSKETICSDCKIQSSELIEINSRKFCTKCATTCKKCSASFSNTILLENHNEIHHISQQEANNKIEISYVCAICKFCYRSKRLLDSHMRVHSGERPYKCNDCEERFSWQHHLHRHIRTTHLEESQIQFPCIICSRNFQNIAKLQMHMRQHGKRFIDDNESQNIREIKKKVINFN